MRKNWIVVVLMASICYIPFQIFAEDTPYNPAEMACIDSNKNAYYYNNQWNPVTQKCECINPEQYVMTPQGCVERTTKAEAVPVTETKKETPKDTLLKIDNYVPQTDNYSNLGSGGEVSFGAGAQYLDSIKNGATEAVYLKKLQEWEKKVSDAEQAQQFKDAQSNADFAIKIQEELNIKKQIVEAERLLGLTHTRVLESTKQSKFEFQSAEYKAFWKQPVENNAHDNTQNAVAFNAASANISGYYSQIRELKQKISNNYPSGWKAKYLVVPEKPVREKSVGNIFNGANN